MSDGKDYSERRIRLDKSILKNIAGLYPSTEYFVEETSFAKTFEESPVRDSIIRLANVDDLALHLVCSPDFLVVPRGKGVDLAENSIFIKIFTGKIALSKRETELYRKYFPLEKVLFLSFATNPPEGEWASVFIQTGTTRSG